MSIRSNAIKVKAIEVLEDSVYLRSNIVRIEEESVEGKEGFIGWEYDEIQYGKDEYIENLTEKKTVQQYLNLLPPVENPITLDDYKQNKIYEVNRDCNNFILSGFNSSCLGENHSYKFDMEYQSNFALTIGAVSVSPDILEIPWPTIDQGILVHSQPQFIQLYLDGKAFMESNLYKYFGMKAQILVMTSLEEINNMVW